MRKTLLAVVIAALAVPSFGAVRLTYDLPGGAVPVFWPASAFPLTYQIDRRAADMLGVATIDRAFADWTTIPEANVSFRSEGVVGGAVGGKDGRNTVSMVDDLFANQHFIGMTTSWYDVDGRMTEADIQIDPMAVRGKYNVQLLVEHEVGHLLGLDHSAVISSVMYPFVGYGSDVALDSDDRIGIAAVYPRVDPTAGATLMGQVTDDSGGVFAAQVVAVNESGEPVSTGLTKAGGEFVLSGLPTGNYRVYAEPLDGPVNAANLSGVWRQAKVVSFPTHFAQGGRMHIDAGKIYGNVNVSSAGAPVTLNPKSIGAFPAGSSNMSLNSSAVSVRGGQTIDLAVGGDGFTSGMTTFEILNPGFQRISDFHYAGNFTYATFRITPDAPAGSAVVLVTSGNDSATLTGALRVQPGVGRARAVAR
ncbi:MAG: metalloendoproteinase 3-MMP-like [Acidobacteria bacterium]|nr:metalloendoproteinase 3-MMP-like [Acidobacteriota bacterium]